MLSGASRCVMRGVLGRLVPVSERMVEEVLKNAAIDWLLGCGDPVQEEFRRLDPAVVSEFWVFGPDVDRCVRSEEVAEEVVLLFSVEAFFRAGEEVVVGALGNDDAVVVGADGDFLEEFAEESVLEGFGAADAALGKLP